MYESSYGELRTLISDSSINLGRKKRNIFLDFNKPTWDEPFVKLQLFLRPYLAMLMNYEKSRPKALRLTI